MDVRARVLALVELAGRDTTPANEASAAAVQACRLIREHALLGERVDPAPPRQAGEAVARIVDPLLVVSDTEKFFKFGVLTRESRTRGVNVYLSIPKHVIRDVSWMAEDEKKKRFGCSGRVTEWILVSRNWAEQNRAS